MWLGKILEKRELPERDVALRDLSKLTANYVVYPTKGQARGVKPDAAPDLSACLLLMAGNAGRPRPPVLASRFQDPSARPLHDPVHRYDILSRKPARQTIAVRI